MTTDVSGVEATSVVVPAELPADLLGWVLIGVPEAGLWPLDWVDILSLARLCELVSALVMMPLVYRTAGGAVVNGSMQKPQWPLVRRWGSKVTPSGTGGKPAKVHTMLAHASKCGRTEVSVGVHEARSSMSMASGRAASVP